MSAPASASDEIEVSERYDKEDDIYYLTVRTGEPSIVQELDDRLMIEMGIFTRMPTGFRILNYTKHQAHAAAFRAIFKAICKKYGLRRIKEAEMWKRQVDRALQQEMA
jgi:hypothetical protein